MLKKKFYLPKGCSVRSFVMREIRGADQLLAAERADHAGREQNLNSIMLLSVEAVEAQRLSLWMVDGKRVNNPDPYKEMDQWNARTKRFLIAAFSDVNGCTDDELRDFMNRAAPYDDKTQTGEAQSGGPDTGVLSENGSD